MYDSQTRNLDDRSDRGSAFFEILLAAVVGVVILGSVLTLTSSNGRRRQATIESSLALSAMLNSLEQVRTVPTAALPGLNGLGFDVPGTNGGPRGLSPIPNDPDGLPGQLEVTVDQSLPGANLYRVRARVAWTGVTGRRNLVLETLVGERR